MCCRDTYQTDSSRWWDQFVSLFERTFYRKVGRIRKAKNIYLKEESTETYDSDQLTCLSRISFKCRYLNNCNSDIQSGTLVIIMPVLFWCLQRNQLRCPYLGWAVFRKCVLLKDEHRRVLVVVTEWSVTYCCNINPRTFTFYMYRRPSQVIPLASL